MSFSSYTFAFSSPIQLDVHFVFDYVVRYRTEYTTSIITGLIFTWFFITSVYFAGTVGIMLGYRFHFSCLVFLIPYWYIVLLEKSDWNNHTYMFGLIALLLFSTNANACWYVRTEFSRKKLYNDSNLNIFLINEFF